MRSGLRRNAVLPWFAAVSVLTTLAACGTSGEKVFLSGVPQQDKRLLEPVAVPEPQEDEDMLVVAARERAGRLDNAGKLVAADQWIDRVRQGSATKDSGDGRE